MTTSFSISKLLNDSYDSVLQEYNLRPLLHLLLLEAKRRHPSCYNIYLPKVGEFHFTKDENIMERLFLELRVKRSQEELLRHLTGENIFSLLFGKFYDVH